MTIHARRIASIPCRTATETWRTICELITPQDGAARRELQAIVGVASALITEEYTQGAPIVLAGTGPQVRIYTLHGDAAIEADSLDEAPLNHDPTDGDWTLSLPCGDDDLDETLRAVSESPHIEVRSLADQACSSSTSAKQLITPRPVIDLAALEQS